MRSFQFLHSCYNIICRKFLGPELVVVILTMPRKIVKKRLKKRHPKKTDKGIIKWLMVLLLLVIVIIIFNIFA